MIDTFAIWLCLVAGGTAAAAPPVATAPASAIAVAGRTDPLPPPPATGDSVLVLPEVRVTRERPLSTARRRLPTAFVTELDARASGRAQVSLAELLTEATGVRVVQYGGLGAFSTVSLRGAPPGQVAVLLDGVPLGSAGHSVVSLSDLPAFAIERVEVYRGLAPFALGAAAPAGAINIVTAPERVPTSLRAVRGSFGTWEARGTAGLRRGRLAVSLIGGTQDSRGDFTYADDNGTPFNTADDSTSVRRNNRFDAASVLANAAWRLDSGTDLRLHSVWFRKRQGVPGLGAVPALGPSLDHDRMLTRLELVRAAAGARPGVRLHGTLLGERTRLHDRSGELAQGPHETDDRVNVKSAGLMLEGPAQPAPLALRATASVRSERARPSDSADPWPDPAESTRHGEAASLSLELHPLGEWFTFHAARRWDRVRDALSGSGLGGTFTNAVTREFDTPQVGARLVVRGFEARANWTDGWRPPDFLELFGQEGSVTGNLGLLPENTRSRDFGLAWHSDQDRPLRAIVQWAHYLTDARDLIVYVRSGPSNVKAANISAARIRGDELSVQLGGPAGLSGTASFTWQKAVDTGSVPFWNGRWLPQSPDRQAYARLAWRHRALSVVTDLQVIGRNYLDRRNTYRVDGRTLVGASVSVPLMRDRLRLTLEGRNLGDGRAADVAGFPLPGRSIFLSIEARLDAGATTSAAPGAAPSVP